ncbi:hypothetical protein [Pontibacter kalidii]|uniref:hypothetical protein n=1 Tax=Pontibacter kalidii TaxID=2592049 RepID=UPI00224FA62E|nr:hypothetical protein [Pontibacter kalidii]
MDIAKTLNKDEALDTLIAEIETFDEKYLNECINALNYIRYEKVLDWIEHNAHKAINISSNWGHVAASSCFNWNRADKWLTKGRPLSLIALDALIFCTTIDERLNQSLWMREIQPTLTDNPKPEIVANRLQKYLQVDNVPRTRDAVKKIINNLFEVEL